MQPTFAGQIYWVAHKIISGKHTVTLKTYIVARFFFDRFLQTTTQSDQHKLNNISTNSKLESPL